MAAADQRHHRGSVDGARSPACLGGARLPIGSARVEITVEAAGDGSRVSIAEDVSDGPARLAPQPLRVAGITYATTRRCAGLLSSLKAATDFDAPALSSPASCRKLG
jgi:hypothetical protein